MVEYSLEFQLGLLKVPCCFNGSSQLSKNCRLKIHVIFLTLLKLMLLYSYQVMLTLFKKSLNMSSNENKLL